MTVGTTVTTVTLSRMCQICPASTEYETVLVALAPAVALLCVLLPDLALQLGLAPTGLSQFAMPCLLDLGVDLVLRVAGLCDLAEAFLLTICLCLSPQCLIKCLVCADKHICSSL